MATETPQFDIINEDGSFAIRKYKGFIMANVKIKSGSYKNAVYSGFNYLADYIFGNNVAADKISMTAPLSAARIYSEKIAMTAPVNTIQEGESYIVSFTMPSNYKLNNLPMPNNKAVFITETKTFYAVAVKLSGYLTDNKIIINEKRLNDWAKINNLEIIGKPVFSQFDPPWKPWFLRHNEIFMEIKKPNG